MADRDDRDGGDDTLKSKAQLIAEIEDLRRRLTEREDTVDGAADPAHAQPALARPVTRRTALTNWVAPVVLSVPLGAMMRPGSVRAGTVPPPTSMPTEFPTFIPTLMPTSVPTLMPTLMPTAFPTSFPTVAPSDTPTETPTATPTNTADAAATQTAAAAATATAAAARVAPVPALSPAGVAAAVAVLAGGAVRQLMRRGAGDAKVEKSDDPQEDEGGAE